MDQHGFIHEKMDIKLLILYVLNLLPAPVDAIQLSELVFCDDGIGYFDYSDCLAELTESGQITIQNGAYQITEIGSKNIETVESSLPYSVRTKARKITKPLADRMRRAALIIARHTEQQDGTFQVELAVTDGVSNLLSMQIMSPSEETAKAMERSFQNRAESIYHDIVHILTEGEEST